MSPHITGPNRPKAPRRAANDIRLEVHDTLVRLKR